MRRALEWLKVKRISKLDVTTNLHMQNKYSKFT